MLGYKPPKDDPKYQWTNHSKEKMAYYRISESLVKRIIRFPKRAEEGIAPNTTAVMQSRKVGQKHPRTEEIWVMYQEVGKSKAPAAKSPKNLLSGLNVKKRIITAWRYPGVSPIRGAIPIPDEILSELEGVID